MWRAKTDDLFVFVNEGEEILLAHVQTARDEQVR